MERSRSAVYRKHGMRVIFESEGLTAPTEEQYANLPTCVSEQRQLAAAAACSENATAFGPQSDPLTQAGLSECGISRMRICGPGDELELEKAGAAGDRKWLIAGAVAVGGVLLYALFR
jgi:hypothetical protein